MGDGVDGDFVAIAAGMCHSLAIRHRDGGISCWGRNREGQAPPEGVDGTFVAIAAGGGHSLALRHRSAGGGVVCWCWNKHGQAPPESVTGDFVAIAASRDGWLDASTRWRTFAGAGHSLALERSGITVAFGCDM